ncbi:hypothetical protein [Clostridium beijerinckii]|uniref:hypothetical protein n=1 Tax=Clostridium beijerinckii TaxID=1520 RepID=UPI00232F1493|nr:hypothetical protein [Clostridium beijerinckii]
MSKKLNIIEAMKMPIGTEFEVIFDGKKIPNNTMVIYRSLASDRNTKHIDWKSHPDGTFMKPYDYLINGVFIPIQQPVSFMEAIEEGSEDKKVKVVMDRITFPKHFTDALNKYMTLNEIFKFMSEHLSRVGIRNVIKEGKWYIEESEADSNE